MTESSDAPLYRDATAAIGERVEDLLARMSIEQKTAQLVGIFPGSFAGPDGSYDPDQMREHIPHGVGHICMGGNLRSETADLTEALNSIQRYHVDQTDLGIPAMVHNEALNGFAQDSATNFPTAIGLASTWRPDLLRQMSTVAATEARAVGVHHVLSPVLDVARDARWGRIHETYGEDPHLCAAMGVAFVQGMQQGDLATGVVCTGKHFLGYSLTEAGLNQTMTTAGPRQLYEVFALPFEAAIREAGLASIMNSYSEIDGEPVAGSHAILTELLRDRLGFDGVVVADYSAVHRLRDPHAVAATDRDAGRIALSAGLDIELPTAIGFLELPAAVEAGELAMEVVDQAVRRTLTHKFAVGLFDSPIADPAHAAAVTAQPESVSLARQITDQSLVLIANDGTLPLPASTGSVAVLGPMGDSIRALFAAYTPASAVELNEALLRGFGGTMAGVSDGPAADVTDDSETGPATVAPPDPLLDVVTHVFHSTTEALPANELDDKIRALYPAMKTIAGAIADHAPVTVVRGCDWTRPDTADIGAAVAAATEAEVALVCVGEKTGWVGDATGGEGRDRSTLGLTGSQSELVREIIATGTPTVVVLLSGRALDIAADVTGARAVLQAWHPGVHGADAIADAIFGVTNPGGKLAISYPASAGASPTYHGHKHGTGASSDRGYVDGSSQPTWPFGHGLSYTTFDVSDLTLSAQQVSCGDTITISLAVTNTGARTGDEVVQVYVRDVIASMVRPVRQLAGFLRVSLDPGETAHLDFEYDTSQLAFLTATDELVIEAGEVLVMAGTSSADLPLETTFEMTDTVALDHRRSFLTPAEVSTPFDQP